MLIIRDVDTGETIPGSVYRLILIHSTLMNHVYNLTLERGEKCG